MMKARSDELFVVSDCTDAAGCVLEQLISAGTDEQTFSFFVSCRTFTVWEPSVLLTALLYSGYTLHGGEETHTHTAEGVCVCACVHANAWFHCSRDMRVFLHVDAAEATGNGLCVKAYSSLAGFLLGWSQKYKRECVCVCVCWGGGEQ